MKTDLEVSVLELWLPREEGNLKAYANVKVGPWTVRKCRLVRQEGQRAYVALPHCKVADGGYMPVLQLEDGDLKKAIENAVLEACHANRKEDEVE